MLILKMSIAELETGLNKFLSRNYRYHRCCCRSKVVHKYDHTVRKSITSPCDCLSQVNTEGVGGGLHTFIKLHENGYVFTESHFDKFIKLIVGSKTKGILYNSINDLQSWCACREKNLAIKAMEIMFSKFLPSEKQFTLMINVYKPAKKLTLHWMDILIKNGFVPNKKQKKQLSKKGYFSIELVEQNGATINDVICLLRTLNKPQTINEIRQLIKSQKLTVTQECFEIAVSHMNFVKQNTKTSSKAKKHYNWDLVAETLLMLQEFTPLTEHSVLQTMVALSDETTVKPLTDLIDGANLELTVDYYDAVLNCRSDVIQELLFTKGMPAVKECPYKLVNGYISLSSFILYTKYGGEWTNEHVNMYIQKKMMNAVGWLCMTYPEFITIEVLNNVIDWYFNNTYPIHYPLCDEIDKIKDKVLITRDSTVNNKDTTGCSFYFMLIQWGAVPDITTLERACELQLMFVIEDIIKNHNIAPDISCLNAAVKSGSLNMIGYLLDFKLTPDASTFNMINIDFYNVLELLIQNGLQITIDMVETALMKKKYIPDLNRHNIPYDRYLYYLCFRYQIWPKEYQDNITDVSKNLMQFHLLCGMWPNKPNNLINYAIDNELQFDPFCFEISTYHTNRDIEFNKLRNWLIDNNCEPTILTLCGINRNYKMVRMLEHKMDFNWEDMFKPYNLDLQYDHIVTPLYVDDKNMVVQQDKWILRPYECQPAKYNNMIEWKHAIIE